MGFGGMILAIVLWLNVLFHNNMKIIFLDIDGVFNSEKYYKQRKDFTPWDESKEFDPECVDIFNYIIGQTGASIVVSSCWRKGNLNYLKELFRTTGICGNVIGETIKLRWNCDYPGVSIPRGCEIKQYYAEKHGFIHYSWKENDSKLKSYVIIDDDSDMLYEQRNNFVKTNSSIGLTVSDCMKAIKILNNKL